MGARRGGTCPPPTWNLKNDVICCRPTTYPKIFARAFGDRYRYRIFQSKTREKTRKFSLAPPARRKMVDFLYGAPKTCQLFETSVVLPPSGKISAGAHAYNDVLYDNVNVNEDSLMYVSVLVRVHYSDSLDKEMRYVMAKWCSSTLSGSSQQASRLMAPRRNVSNSDCDQNKSRSSCTSEVDAELSESSDENPSQPT